MFNSIVIVGIGALVLSVACTSERFVRQESVDQLRSLCSLEAELLVRPVIIYKEQVETNSEVVMLKAGSLIYRCEKRPGWAAVMYPREGEKVDCNYRKDKRLCPIGWVKGELVTSTVD
jgi:hypothetical protein